jgi:hypothetical protein
VICRNKEKERDKPIPTGFDFGNRPLFSNWHGLTRRGIGT